MLTDDHRYVVQLAGAAVFLRLADIEEEWPAVIGSRAGGGEQTVLQHLRARVEVHVFHGGIA
jgi:hypothetical protein